MNGYASPAFRKKIQGKLSKHGNKTLAAYQMKISRKALWQFLSGRKIRRTTLEAIVKRFEGENANVEDYIKPI